MKNRYVVKKKQNFIKWTTIGNIFAKSLCPNEDILKQYNRLTSSQRIKIKQLFSQCDDIRRKKIPVDEASFSWEIGIMVDAHIIACEYEIDPLTAVLCINPICKPNEKIFIK